MENSKKNEALPLSQLVYNDITRCPKSNLICSLSLSDNPSIINYNCENNHNDSIEIQKYLILNVKIMLYQKNYVNIVEKIKTK